MAISKVNFNSLNVTPTASKTLKFNSSNDGLEAGDVGGALVLISEQTASSSSTISFTSGIDSTYKEYIFKFIDIHPGTAGVFWTFQANASGGSGFNETITSTSFRAVHTEAGSGQLDYIAGIDQANGTSFQNIISDGDIKTDNDSSLAGTLQLFNPSDTTFVKHFIATTNHMVNNSQISNNYVAGYFNTTSAIDEIQFKFDSGNIDAGTIKMYGVV
jgi:hypothetical protein